MPPKKAAARKKAAPAKRPAARPRPASRTSRAETLRRERERRSLRRRIITAGVMLAALVGVFVFTRADDDAAVIAELEASGACAYDTVTDSDPPSAGDVEAEAPAEPGFYTPDDDAVPSDRALLRAMRQGFVVAWYPPADEPGGLQAVSDRVGRDLIVVPHAGLSTAVVFTAWERRLVCSTFDEAAAARFVDAFRDKGPEKGFL